MDIRIEKPEPVPVKVHLTLTEREAVLVMRSVGRCNVHDIEGARFPDTYSAHVLTGPEQLHVYGRLKNALSGAGIIGK